MANNTTYPGLALNFSDQLNQTNWQFCYLPSELLEFPPRAGVCPSESSSLISLAIYNGLSGAFNLILGHAHTQKKIQDQIPTCLTWLKSSSCDWSPHAALFMTGLQILGMVLTTIIARSNGFAASFVALLGLWTLRPRLALLTFLYDFCSRCKIRGRVSSCIGLAPKWENPYSYTLRDTIFSESLLNLFSVYFALNLFQQMNLDGFECQNRDSDPRILWVSLFKAALGWKIVGGVLSAFVLAVQFINYLKGEVKLGKRIWLTALSITYINFLTSWGLWILFIIKAKATYCPGSIVGTSITWGIILTFHSLMRCLLGGGTMS